MVSPGINKELWITGDPMVDVFLEGEWNNNRFVPSGKKIRPGGAWNTAYNAAEICRDTDIDVHVGWCGSPFASLDWFLHLYRLRSEAQELEFYLDPMTNRETYYSNEYSLKSLVINSKSSKGSRGLVISDYNRGLVNNRRKVLEGEFTKLSTFDFVIVDSRYRSVDLSLIRNIPTKIWRCSGNECTREWIHNFDWVVGTSNGGPIFIEEIGKEGTHIFSPPQIEDRYLDTCGAGDTFTAALAAHLLNNDKEIEMDSMKEAAYFASQAACNVITKQYTAVTDLKL